MEAYYIQDNESGDCWNDGQWCEEPELFPSWAAADRALRRINHPSPVSIRSAEVEDDE